MKTAEGIYLNQDSVKNSGAKAPGRIQSGTEIIKDFLKRNGVWIGFLVLACVATYLTDGGFIAPRNLTNLLRQASINGVLAAGMTLVILHGGIDLSIGSLVALAGVAVGVSQVFWGWNATGIEGALMS